MSYPQYTQTPSIPDDSSVSGQPSAAMGEPTMTEQATEAAEQAKQAANQVAQSVTDQAGEVKDEAVRQARDLLGEARGQLTEQARAGHQALVSNLRNLSSELGRMTEGAQQPGVATELAGRAKQHTSAIADWLESKDPAQVIDEVRHFARRRPGTFLLGALAAGVVAGRLARSAVEVHTGDSSDGAHNGANANAQPVAGAAVPSYSTPAQSSPGYGAAGPATTPLPQTGPSYSAPAAPVTGHPSANEGGW